MKELFYLEKKGNNKAIKQIKEKINMFIDDLVKEQPTGVPNAAASSQRNGETRKVLDGTQVVIKKDNDVYDLSRKRVKKNTFDLRKQSKYLNDNEDVPE